jgi:hypothetical protein
MDDCDEFLWECEDCHDLFDLEQMVISYTSHNLCQKCYKLDLTFPSGSV